ncbi:MAG: sugar phosphate isomerase/epimerase [Clostridiaceae bacterium]|jgi:D-psicose/D-tagatose/L-ribulose 3-epimerase|nr:sugar phosphate isomerase/epimerase [Clostridiaceae bacterium]
MMIGASSYIWVSPFSTDKTEQLAHAKEIGFDVYEIAVERPELIDEEKVLTEAQKAGIKVYVCGAYGETRDISSDVPEYRDNGMAYGKRLIDMAAALGSPYVAGPMYAAVGRTRLADRDEKERQMRFAVENMKRLADYASGRGVKLAIEPLNRFETDFINTVEQGLYFLDRIGYDNVGFLLDTFHMNIEEKSIPDAIRSARGRIFDFHACANDRGTPGEDHFNWEEIRGALKETGYEGPVVIESFTPGIREIAKAVSLWRQLAESPDCLARNGLRFLRSVFG